MEVMDAKHDKVQKKKQGKGQTKGKKLQHSSCPDRIHNYGYM
jgi:hypothetical protein